MKSYLSFFLHGLSLRSLPKVSSFKTLGLSVTLNFETLGPLAFRATVLSLHRASPPASSRHQCVAGQITVPSTRRRSDHLLSPASPLHLPKLAPPPSSISIVFIKISLFDLSSPISSASSSPLPPRVREQRSPSSFAS